MPPAYFFASSKVAQAPCLGSSPMRLIRCTAATRGQLAETETASSTLEILNKKVKLEEPAPDKGRSLVAVEDIPAGDVVLSLPYSEAFTVQEQDPEYDELPWSIELALRILERKDSESRCGVTSAWFKALPPQNRVSLPTTSFTYSELQACQDEPTIQSASFIRDMLGSASEALAGDIEGLRAKKEDLTWAVSLAHSRSFVVADPENAITHILAPGIDMANHSFEPTASVRIQRSPDECQGRSAVEEVCDVTEGTDSQIHLLAGEDGIRKGEEVTISYGAYPDDVFFLFFGFLPESNPFNIVELFSDLADLGRFLPGHFSPPEGVEWNARLIATAEGFDKNAFDPIMYHFSQRHMKATWQRLTAEEQQKIPFAGELGIAEVTAKTLAILSQRCQNILDAFPTSVQEDMALLEGAENMSASMHLSTRYRLRKKLLLQHAMSETAKYL